MKNKTTKTAGKMIIKTVRGLILAGLMLTMWTPSAMAAIKCDQLNTVPTEGVTQDAANANIKSLEKYIINILEEEISTGATQTESANGEEGPQSMTCFRVTTCKTTEGEDAGIACTSKYADTCSPNPPEVYCQRVQVLISQSGIDLLMLYLGIIYRWAAGVIGIISVAYLIYGGFLIGTAQDDSSKIDKAKEKIFQSIAGLVLLFLSAVILYTINPNFFTL